MFNGFLFAQLMRQQCGRVHMKIEHFGIRAGDLLVCEGGEGGRCSLVKEVQSGYIIKTPFTA